VQALDLHDIDLVGHSTGGAVALEYALVHPERVATLSLIAPPSPEGVLTPLEGIMLLQQMRTDHSLLIDGLAALMPTFAGVPPASDAEAGQFFTQLVDDAASQAPAAFTEIAVALGSWNRFVEAGQLTLPTLLIWGDQDGIVEQDAMRRTLLAIPGAANLEILRGVGHSPMIEAPLRLAERIINFITEDYAGFDQIRNEAYD
jgi:pimeloyl-ACP methyl ester carboxylesterase